MTNLRLHIVENILSFYDGKINPCFEKAVIECNQCNRLLRVPTGKGKLKVKCTYCSNEFNFKPGLLSNKFNASIFVFCFSLLFSTLFSYFSSYFDISGFYLFFIIPIGAVLFGFTANFGLITGLAYLKNKGISYRKETIIILTILVTFYSFISMHYISYIKEDIQVQYIDDRGNVLKELTEKVSDNISFGEYIIEINKNSSFQFFGMVNEMPIITPEIQGGKGTLGIALFWVQFFTAIFALPINWFIKDIRKRKKITAK